MHTDGMEYIAARTILARVKNAPDALFGGHYTMNLYRGCPHGCIYCDTRSNCYGIGRLEHIRAKRHALEILWHEVVSKRARGTVVTGSMHDPYLPQEKEEQLTRSALKLLIRHGFGVHVITKGTLVTRDADLLAQAQRTFGAVSITVTTPDDGLAAAIEPHAPPPSMRFKALAALRAAGVYAGITLMPVLPFITDSPRDITRLVRCAADAGAAYVLFWPGMTLRDACREHYLLRLEHLFPGMARQYRRRYGDRYVCMSPAAAQLNRIVDRCTAACGMERSVRVWQPPRQEQGRLL